VAYTPKRATAPQYAITTQQLLTPKQRDRRRIWRLTGYFTVVVLLFLNIQRFLSTPPALAAVACHSVSNVLTVPLRATTTPLALQLSTNVVKATQLDPAADANANAILSYLQQWNPPLVRLHFGFREQTTLPESQQGVWDFQRTDTAIAQLRAQGVSFVLNIRSAPPWMFAPSGQLRDPTFHEFALYVARLVGWYNKGGFTDDNGVFHASGHVNWVHTWEIWNEPDSGDEIPAPVPDRNGQWASAQEYAQLYSTVVQAMRGVDPTVVAGGPALIWQDPTRYAPYIQTFLQDVTQPVAFVSIHFYPTGDLNEPDQAVLQQVTTTYHQIVAGVQNVMKGKHIPLWVDELGFNESSRLPIDPRGTSPIAYAFIADIFTQSAVLGVAQVDQFPFASNAQYGELDEKTGQPFRTYWLYRRLSQAFPPGSQLLAVTTLPTGITALTALSPDRHTLSILLDNMRAAHAKDVNGPGVSQSVCIDLLNTHAGIGLPFGAPATAWTFDASTPPNDAPPSATQWLLNAGQDHLFFQEQLTGYSATLVQLPIN
jgi:hypothetical protein